MPTPTIDESRLETFQDVTEIRETLSQIADGVNQVNLQVLPQSPESLSSFLTRSLEELRQVLDGHKGRKQQEVDALLRHEMKPDEVAGVKLQASGHLFDARQDFLLANTSFIENGGKVDTPQLLKALTDYAEGYHAYTQLCTGAEPASVVQIWNTANAGNEVNCGQLLTSQKSSEEYVSTAFAPITRVEGGSHFLDKIWEGRRFSFGPLVAYQRDSNFAYAQGGFYGEALFRIRPDSSFMAGASFQFLVRNSYATDPASPSKGELQTTELSLVPPVLEGGYDSRHFSAFVVAGAYLTAAKVPESDKEDTPYSSRFFENPTYLAGMKLVFLNHRLGVEGDLIDSKGKPGYRVSVVADLNFWRKENE